MVGATIEVYNGLRATLLPTPAKSHYTYNMRDLSKVFQVRAAGSTSWLHMPACVSSYVWVAAAPLRDWWIEWYASACSDSMLAVSC